METGRSFRTSFSSDGMTTFVDQHVHIAGEEQVECRRGRIAGQNIHHPLETLVASQ